MPYGDVIMGAMASQITSLTIVYSTVYSSANQRKHQSSASLAFVRGIHRRPVNSPHKWPVTRKMFPFDDVIMEHVLEGDAIMSCYLSYWTVLLRPFCVQVTWYIRQNLGPGPVNKRGYPRRYPHSAITALSLNKQATSIKGIQIYETQIFHSIHGCSNGYVNVVIVIYCHKTIHHDTEYQANLSNICRRQ